MAPIIRVEVKSEPELETVNQPVTATDEISNVEKKVSTLENIGNLIGEGLKRYFSEAAIFARMKTTLFAGVLLFMGSGFVGKLVGSAGGSSVDVRWLEFALTGPDLGQAIGALVAFGFVIGSNLYYRLRKQKADDKALEIASNPATPEDVKK